MAPCRVLSQWSPHLHCPRSIWRRARRAARPSSNVPIPGIESYGCRGSICRKSLEVISGDAGREGEKPDRHAYWEVEGALELDGMPVMHCAVIFSRSVRSSTGACVNIDGYYDCRKQSSKCTTRVAFVAAGLRWLTTRGLEDDNPFLSSNVQ